ncbi:serine-rich adhesin for platelets isoform X2 [Drosophila subpulchrella]|uniref:serine-rich adhesin for platelets isoform X2 n=1 Tax=Drosophila subpulchrella TaxID=1486046 RepID=UPI0018A12728|nr:serine-rich adhesin for platelets isoform X2 [Drosophila subpulchrella]
MLLLLLAFIMRFVDISKRCAACSRAGIDCPHNGNGNSNSNSNNNNDANGNSTCWQHVAGATSNSSSTSSGCDSNSSSKENYYVPQQQQHRQRAKPNGNIGVTPQQLEQIRFYQRMQQQQLQLLQQQLLQRRRLQQQLLAQGVPSPPATTTTSAGLTCNQQYLRQQRLQQQQQQQRYVDHNSNSNNDNDYLNNYLNNNINHQNNGKVVGQGTKLRRGMTEFSTNNDHSKPHFTASQQKPLQNSPIHQQAFTPSNPNSHPHLLQRLAQQQQQQHQRPHKFQQTLPFSQLNNGNNTAAHTLPGSSSSPHSPLSYRNPLNSPSNSPFSNTAHTTIGKRYQQQQLTDRLLQQQHLQQCQQQQLQSLGSDVEEDAAGEELSEESLKQNVAIVLSNLDRYNNALRSIILNEQVSSSLITPSDSLLFGEDSSGLLYCDNDNSRKLQGNNNFILGKMAATPESDYNSNATTPGGRSNEQQLQQQQQQQQQQLGVGGMLCGGGGMRETTNGGGNNLICSLASSHDFTHDNSDYQWFLDYGYRDGCGGMQRSVLSSLSASYNAMGDLIYYEDLAKNLDANLAEVDMESFRAEDIHSLLSQLPAYCKSLGGANSRLQQSLLLQQQQQQQQQQMQQQQLLNHSNMMPHNMSQTSTTSTNELIDNSFCKSELLFSPVRESHISVDSLDMDAYPDDGEIILTCNKDNYTIAFEGSVLYSDDSFYAEPSDLAARNKQNCINLHSNLEDIVKRNKALEVSMSRSAQAFQPLCPMSPKGQAATASAARLQRYPSGNNNTETITITRHLPQCSVRKSSSLPNLQSEELMTGSCHKEQRPEESGQQAVQLNVSQAISTSTMESCKSRSRNLLPMCQMPISISVSISERLQQQADQQVPSQQITPTSQQPQQQQPHHSHHHRHKHRCSCSQESQNFHISGSASSGNSSNPPAFNLVKLFIKQKSSNSSGGQEDLGAQASAHTCMDVSSGCWPSSDAASSSSGSLEQRLRKKSMNDSGKGSAVSRHDEEEHYPETETPRRQLRARSEAVFYDDVATSSSTGSLTATNSPAHRRRSMPLRNPQLYQLAAQVSTGSQMSSEASSEQLTQVPRRAEAGCGTSTRPLSCASSSEMITRSMQTSCGSLSTTRSSLSDRYRCVPPSFLEKLNNLGEQCQAPIYVIYPNYALPDLGFVKTNASTDVIFQPFNYKMTLDGAAGSTSSSGSLKKQRSNSQSVSEDEILKTLDYKHIADWQSLATLLPTEYRRRLQHIPEVKHLVRQLDAELSQRPLFCMSPPLRRNRTHICDCAKYFQGQQTQQMDEASSSGSSQPPSSGYRGSSTLLTDSELDVDPLKQMYVYQYDQQRMDSGVETSPGSQLTQTPPQPMPRSILRKAHSAQARSKRNSMIEQQTQQTQKLSKLEKRRSLQEPPHNYGLGSTDELADVFEEEEHSQQAQPVKQRLSRKDLDARARAENFLASLPRSELKYYAEIASILESSGEQVTYDAAALKKEVSRVLSQQKKVSFNDEGVAAGLQQHAKRFATPPNSPNISVAALKRDTLDVQEQRKIESNRFKRLQIQWELMSKDSSMLKELASEAATKSGGSTPTSATSTGSNSAPRSRIPRPVSYPAGRGSTPTSSRTAPVMATPSPARPANPKTVTKSHNKPGLFTSPRPNRLTSAQEAAGGAKVSTRSPSRMVQPKRYSLVGTTTPTSATPTSARARTPTNRVAVTAPNTPKRQAVAPSPRPTSRVR